MTARVYPNAFGQFANGTLEWTALNVKALLLSEAFVYDETNQFRDEINESFVISTSSALTNPSVDGDVYGGDPIEFLQLLDNKVAQHVVLFDDTGDDAYSELLFYAHADDIEGLPSALEGANYYLYPVSPPGGFFSLGDYSSLLGPINTYSLAYQLPLGESIGTVSFTIPTLVFGLDLDVRDKICLLPDALDTDECGPPTIRSSLCG